MPLKHPLLLYPPLPVPSNIQITPSAQAVILGESIDFTVTADDESGEALPILGTLVMEIQAVAPMFRIIMQSLAPMM